MRKKVYQLIVLDEYGGVGVKTTEKHPELKELQRIVDGYIEVVSFNLQGGHYLMIVDEDGVFNNKKFNCRASEVYGNQIFGPAVILQEDGEEMAAFTSDEIPYIVNSLIFAPYLGGADGPAVRI